MLNLSELNDVLETPGLRGASCGFGPWGPGRRLEEVLRCISQLKACFSPTVHPPLSLVRCPALPFLLLVLSSAIPSSLKALPPAL